MHHGSPGVLDLAEDVPHNVHALASTAWEVLSDEGGDALTPQLVIRALRRLVGRDRRLYLTVERPDDDATASYTSRMNDEALEQIQTKIAFLERATTELSDVVFRQHKEIQALEAKLKTVADRLSGAQVDESPRPPDQEKPPHY